jgi:hypothetical protein
VAVVPSSRSCRACSGCCRVGIVDLETSAHEDGNALVYSPRTGVEGIVLFEVGISMGFAKVECFEAAQGKAVFKCGAPPQDAQALHS